MISKPIVNSANVSWGSLIASLFALVGSLLVSMQSRRMNPPHTFDRIQTRVDAFVR